MSRLRMVLAVVLLSSTLMAFAGGSMAAVESSNNVELYASNALTKGLKNNNAANANEYKNYLAASGKSADADKKLQAASAVSAKKGSIEKNSADKDAKKNKYLKAAAGKARIYAVKNSAAGKQKTKKYNRAKNSQIYSSKESDVIESYVDSKAYANANAKVMGSKMMAAKAKGSNSKKRKSAENFNAAGESLNKAALIGMKNNGKYQQGDLKKGTFGRKKAQGTSNKMFYKKSTPQYYKSAKGYSGGMSNGYASASFPSTGSASIGDIGSAGSASIGDVGSAGSASIGDVGSASIGYVPNAGSASYGSVGSSSIDSTSGLAEIDVDA